MRNLLKKEQVLILEQAVDWNKSALGILTNALFRPISYLTGSIKKGIKQQQVQILVKQWGLEYVNAIKKVDEEEGGVSDDSFSTSTDSSVGISDENKKKYAETLTSDLKKLQEVEQYIKTFTSLSNIDQRTDEFNALKNNINGLQFQKDTVNTIITNKKDIPNIENIKIIEILNDLNKYLINIKNSKEVREFLVEYNNIANFYKISKQLIVDIQSLCDAYEIIIAYLKDAELGTSNESLINEANEYKLPSSVTDLISEDDLERIKSIEDIKSKTASKLNYERLNTIKYEANYLIEKSKSDKNKDDTADKLKRIWDLGVQNTNDYFQEVIDTDKIKKNITGKTDAETKTAIENDQNSLDLYQKMGITETFPVGTKFDSKKLYAFDVTFIGQIGKSKKSILLLSPTKEFVESIDGNKYFWFKLFGEYTWSKQENKVIRKNLFSKMTQNVKMINNFAGEDNAYFIALRMLRPASQGSPVFMYSNKGGYFYNNDITEVDKVTNDLKNYKKEDLNKSIKDISKVSNIFKINVIQRFEINPMYVQDFKYPGVTNKSINDDQGFSNAKKNHDKLINILK